jgi:ABC-2 type transport system permease protein
MSLPVPVRTIIYSRFLNMYLWNTFLSLLVMFPMGIVYAVFSRPTLGFYILWLVGIFLTCLIPTTLAAVFGAMITAISAKFRYASAVSTILSILFVVGLMVFSMTATTSNTGISKMFDSETGNIDVESFSALAPVLSDSLNQVYPPAKLFTEAVVNGSIGSFLLFAGISIGWNVLFVLLLSIKYRQINTALTSHRSRADFKLESLQQGSMLAALYRKTIMRILKSTVCATNLLVGCVLAVLLAVGMLIAGPEKMMKSLDMSDYVDIVKNAACYVIAAMVCMTNTAAISLALEGKTIWLIKSLPISPKILYDSYLLTNLTFTVPTSIICSILFSISLQTGFIGTTLMILTPLTFALFTAVVGIFIGNRLAYYDWQEETQLIKQSMMSAIGMLGGMVLIFICGVIANIGVLPLDPNMITFLLNLLILVFTAFIYLNEGKRPVRD